MKPVYVKKNYVWLGTLVTGILLMLVGVVQMGVGLHAKNIENQALSDISQMTGNIFDKNIPGEKAGSDVQGQDVSPEATNSPIEAENQKAENQKKKQSNISEAAPHNYFAEYRLERDRTRSQQIDLMREIVNNENSTVESRTEAQRRILKISQAIETEMKLENLIMAEEIKDCVVIIHDNEKSATIIVQVPVLTSATRNKILQIASRVTGLEKENINIIAKT